MYISLISAEHLREMSERPAGALKIIDTRPIEDYEQGHIPQALHFAWEDWCAKPPEGLSQELNQPGYWGLLSEVDELAVSKRLSELGLQNDLPVVIYADGPKSKGREGRIAWMLLYFGAKDVRILNGGISAWKNLGGGLEKGDCSAAVSNATGNFHVSCDERRRVLLSSLKQMMDNGPPPVLIDTRTPQEFEGDSYPYMPRTGSLPLAHLVPYVSIFRDDGSFIEKEKFESMMPVEKNTDGKTITFCEVGVRACTVALLHEIYSGEIVAVYDGSIMEWGADPRLPMSHSKKRPVKQSDPTVTG